jgi:pyruvate dehydrogenase E2 component (dihydrolipoamide acetyltransferase)
MADFVMPILGADMSAGTLVAWHKKPGDVVRRGDVVAEVETDKGVIDVEIFTTGTIERLLIQPGEKVPVGTVLATVREEGAAVVGVPVEPRHLQRRSDQRPRRHHRPCVCRRE